MTRLLVVAAAAAALLGVVVGGDVGQALDVAAITSLAAAPMIRLISCAISWTRRGDSKYALAAWLLVLLMASSVIGVALWR